MTYSGHVRNGQIALDEPARLPEGAAVTINVLAPRQDEPPVTYNRRQILAMSIKDRRKVLAEQSHTLEGHYDADPDRSEWQGGDIVE